MRRYTLAILTTTAALAAAFVVPVAAAVRWRVVARGSDTNMQVVFASANYAPTSPNAKVARVVRVTVRATRGLHADASGRVSCFNGTRNVSRTTPRLKWTSTGAPRRFLLHPTFAGADYCSWSANGGGYFDTSPRRGTVSVMLEVPR
jgi:hypothetical protein